MLAGARRGGVGGWTLANGWVSGWAVWQGVQAGGSAGSSSAGSATPCHSVTMARLLPPASPPPPACSLPQGKLVNETRCLQCETVTSREEDFYDLSLEIDQNCSLTSCLRNFRWAGPGAWGLGCTPGGVSVMFVGMHCVCVCVCVAAVACPPAFTPLLPLLTA